MIRFKSTWKGLASITCGGLITLAGGASASDDVEGLDARWLAQASCAPQISLTLRLQSQDTVALDLGTVEMSPPLLDHRPAPQPAPAGEPGEDDPDFLPTGPSSPTFGAVHLSRDPGLMPPRLQPGESTDLLFTLDSPQADGLYRETVTVDWDYDPQAGRAQGEVNRSEAVLHYRVQGSCFEPLSLAAFHQLADPRRDLNASADGLEAVDSVPGFSDFDPVNRPESDAVVLTEVKGAAMTDLFNDDPVTSGGSVINTRYCMRIRYRDNFNNCATDTTGLKWWRPYCDGRSVPLLGLEVYLFDRDSASNDDWIGAYALHYDDIDTYACIDVEWNQNLRGEAYPDIYAMTNFDVHDTEFGASEQMHLCRSNQEAQDECDDKFRYDWRDDYEPNVGSGSTAFQSLHFGSKTNTWNRRAMVMATVQKTLRSTQGLRMTGDMNAWWDGDQCKSGSDPWPCSYDDNWFTVTSGRYRNWFTAPHEVGHTYQKQLFEQDRLYGASCPSPHSATVANNESCATREGWAQFFSALTWYTGSDAKNGGTPRYKSHRIETGVDGTACADRSETEIQVVRTLWDIYDNSVDGLDTAPGVNRFEILKTWDVFNNGTGNHNDKESGADGGNLRDFKHNASWKTGFPADIEDALRQNDTDCQLDT